MYIDVFNGDADGICALQQLRLAEPVKSELVTGIKRDISLLQKVEASSGDLVTVLDVSLDKNRTALLKLLDAGVEVTYFDHHYAGEIPQHPQLNVIIDTQPTICTSLLVNDFLQGQYLAWAVTAAFGDNLYESAITAAKPLGLPEELLEQLKILGTCINYNGYGASLEDLFFHPAVLYEKIKPYTNPFDFIAQDEAFLILKAGYEEDLRNAQKIKPESLDAHTAIYILPDAKWARRVSGVYSNDLTQANPARAHAVLTRMHNSHYQVSVRAPLTNRTGADTLCRQFETGGGRQAAAGINVLPDADVERFIQTFQQQFSSPRPEG
jgi:hypothetical protein